MEIPHVKGQLHKLKTSQPEICGKNIKYVLPVAYGENRKNILGSIIRNQIFPSPVYLHQEKMFDKKKIPHLLLRTLARPLSRPTGPSPPPRGTTRRPGPAPNRPAKGGRGPERKIINKHCGGKNNCKYLTSNNLAKALAFSESRGRLGSHMLPKSTFIFPRLELEEEKRNKDVKCTFVPKAPRKNNILTTLHQARAFL